MKKFDSAYIEITNRCNLTCSFCPGTQRQKKDMSADLFENILGELEGKSRFIFFHVMGEPLLHKDLELFLTLAHKYHHRVNITTNGTLLLDRLIVLKNAPALRQVNISLHWLAEIEGDIFIDDYMDKVLHFINETKEKKDYYITLRLWNMDATGINKKNEKIAQILEKEFSTDISITNTKATYKGIRLASNIFLNHDTSFQWPSSINAKTKNDHFCTALRNQIAILADGTVVPCCLDSEGTINLGNITKNSLESIFDTKRAKNLYNGFSNRNTVEKLCQGCGYKSLYKK